MIMDKKIKVSNILLQLLKKNRSAINGQYWIVESARFEELLFCFMSAHEFKDPKICRRAIESMRKKTCLIHKFFQEL